MNAFFFIFLLFSIPLCGKENNGNSIEMGFSYFDSGKFQEAKAVFQALQSNPNPSIHHFSILGLAKIALEEHHFLESAALLKKLDLPYEKLLPAELKYEWIYTQGDLKIRQRSFEAGKEWLKKALPQKNQNLAPWKPKILLLLAKASLQEAEEALDPAKKNKALQEADTYFTELITEYPEMISLDEMNRFKLAKAYLLHDYETLIQDGLLTDEEKRYLKLELLAKKGERNEALFLFKNEIFSPPLHEKQLFLMGTLFYEEKNFKESALQFKKLIASYPNSPLYSTALYWLGRIGPATPNPYFKELFEKFPEHPLSQDAYFSYYSPQDYLLGDRAAIKHLHDFKTKFPDSKLLIHASYLEGLDFLHDRRSPEGKWISRQNYIAAIDAFHRAETLFDTFHEKEPLNDLIPLRYQALMEKGKANLKVAEQAKLAKKAIYLDYAKGVFENLILDLNDPTHSLTCHFCTESMHPLLEESLYYLALSQIQADEKDNAIKTLDALLSKYEEKNVKKGYWMASAFYQKGLLINDLSAVDVFEQALIAGSPSYLSNDEILNVLIAKAESYRLAGLLDDAMLQLSEVVNYNTASALRLKAMYLRAGIYEDQGRKPLAQKQLESIALKGGEWALKAKEQLDKYYGYD